MARTIQEPYIRARENPFFNGIRGSDSTMMTDDFKDSVRTRNISRSSSDLTNTRLGRAISDLAEIDVDDSSKNSATDIVLEPYGRSSSGKWSKVTRPSAFSLPVVQFDLSNDTGEAKNSRKASTSSGLAGPTVEKSYSVYKKRQNHFQIPLPHSAAAFYNGYSPQMEIVESCEGIDRLNLYLKATRDDVNAGIPGRFLHAVMGQDNCDVGSIASTIMYAFYLNETLKGTLKGNQLCTVPVINMKRAELAVHAELQWLLDSCYIDQSFLIFVDEIDLSYYDLFGSLKLVLLNGSKLPPKQEGLQSAVVEIFNCRMGDSVYSWVENVTMAQECSCCTLIAEKFALTSPEILAGQGFSRLLLSGILCDSGNLTNLQCTSKDKYMATLLINGAGRFGCDGLYQILRFKMHDVSDLKVGDLLRKDFKKWTKFGKPDGGGLRMMVSHVGMSSIGISVGQLLHEDMSTQEIISFQQSEKLQLLLVVSGYYDSKKNFKVSASSSLSSPYFAFCKGVVEFLCMTLNHVCGLNRMS